MNEPSVYNRSAQVAFFFEHAGYNFKAPETEAQGRQRCAEALADARLWAFVNDCTFEWEIDQTTNSSDFSDEKPAWSLWSVLMRDAAGKIVQSLGGVDFGRDAEPWGEAYRIVCEAELALEQMP